MRINKEGFNYSKINDLTYLGGGTYGKAYTDGKYTIKIYKESLEYGANPCLKMSYKKKKLMLQRASYIKKTNLPIILLCEKDKIIGVKSIFSPGSSILKCKNKNLLHNDNKNKIASDLIEASKELTDNKIYCLDYKLDNAIYDDKTNNACFIDVDDTLSKYCLFKNILYKKIVLRRLRDLIISIYVDEYTEVSSPEYKKRVLHDHLEELNLFLKKNVSYKDLEEYVKRKKM